MTYIDLEKLKQLRTIDPFAFAPIDIEATVAFTGEVIRDETRRHAEAMAEPGVAFCRMLVASPTARLRQRLAILGWLPSDPSADDEWYIDEPVELRPGDNDLVAGLVATHCAEGMNLLFAPGDGMFSGDAFAVAPGAGASREMLRERVRLLAERAWVGKAIIVPRVTLSWFEHGAKRAIERENAARARAGLPALAVPGRSTLGRWLREIAERHRDRPGTGRDWCNHEGPVGPASDAGVVAPALRTSYGVSGRVEAATMRVLAAARSAPVAAVTRADRAGAIMRVVPADAGERGRWEATDLGGGRIARELVVDFGVALQARITTRFSGVEMQPTPAMVEKAWAGGLAALEIDDAVVDVYFEGVGKVLSVGTRDGGDAVISMTPGPWEAVFGLPDRPWSPAMLRRLANRR